MRSCSLDGDGRACGARQRRIAMQKRPSLGQGGPFCVLRCNRASAVSRCRAYLGGAGVNPSRLWLGSGLGLGFGAFLTSFLPLSLLPMGRSVTQKGRAGKGLRRARAAECVRFINRSERLLKLLEKVCDAGKSLPMHMIDPKPEWLSFRTLWKRGTPAVHGISGLLGSGAHNQDEIRG